jgi:hypothetical protein
MTVGEWNATEAFVVGPDPRRQLDPNAVEAQYELAREIWSELSDSHELVRRADTARTQVEDWSGRVDDEAIKTLAAAIIERLDGVEGEIREPTLESSQDMLNIPSKIDNQLVYLMSVVEDTPGAPTTASRERFAELKAALVTIEAELDDVLDNEVPKLEAMLEEQGVPRIETK